jgi:hypothetical protein
MAQHDYIIANQSGAAFRSDLNNGLAAIVSNNSGAAEPSTTYAYQWWADTTTGLLKIRNAANNAWIEFGSLTDATIALSRLAAGALPTNVTVASANIVDGTIVNADINASAGIVDTKLATISTAGKVSNSATTATDANTASAIVARDASGNFSAGTITAALTGAASSNLLKAGDTMTGDVTFVTAQPRVARAWATYETIDPTSILASFNIASFTDLGVGKTRLTFTNAMPNTNYATTGAGSTPTSGVAIVRPVARNTANVEITTEDTSGSDIDADYVGVAIFL